MTVSCFEYENVDTKAGRTVGGNDFAGVFPSAGALAGAGLPPVRHLGTIRPPLRSCTTAQ